MPVTEDLLQVSEETIMKLRAISILFSLGVVGVCGASFAAEPSEMLPSLTVHGAPVNACVPPNDQAGNACTTFDQLVRANFTSHEIGMLFGYRTSYPEYRTGGIDRLQRRYQAVMQAWVAAQQAASKNATVATR